MLSEASQQALLVRSNECYAGINFACWAGKHTGHVEQTAGALSVVLEWPEPGAGHGSDRMSCPSPNELIILSTVTVGSKTASYKSIYRRA